eukprot:Amastigsp_a369_1841.p3 type:complete len:104 gc:universal Amastigsp_a369_1841:816-1127(+)
MRGELVRLDRRRRSSRRRSRERFAWSQWSHCDRVHGFDTWRHCSHRRFSSASVVCEAVHRLELQCRKRGGLLFDGGFAHGVLEAKSVGEIWSCLAGLNALEFP